MYNPQQIEEIRFWVGLYNQNINNYNELRKRDFEERNEHLKLNEKTKGLDYGCGLLSMLESSGLEFDAIDPLMTEYKKILELGDNYKEQTKEKYDWIWCVNVLDHDAKPENIIKDIKNKLNKGGKLYFEVNFDDDLSPAHFEIFNKARVDELLKDFKCIWSKEVRNNNYPQTMFYALYEI